MALAIDINPKQGSSCLCRAQIHAGNEDIDLAIEDCRKASEMNPTNFRNSFYLGFLLLEQEKYEEASDVLDHAVESEPLYTETCSYRGYARMWTRDFEGAAEDYSILIEREPDDGRHYQRRAQAYEAYPTFEL